MSNSLPITTLADVTTGTKLRDMELSDGVRFTARYVTHLIATSRFFDFDQFRTIIDGPAGAAVAALAERRQLIRQLATRDGWEWVLDNVDAEGSPFWGSSDFPVGARLALEGALTPEEAIQKDRRTAAQDAATADAVRYVSGGEGV